MKPTILACLFVSVSACSSSSLERRQAHVALIRSHLAEEAERFARGDFHDPAMIHGDDMAGLLRVGSGTSSSGAPRLAPSTRTGPGGAPRFAV